MSDAEELLKCQHALLEWRGYAGEVQKRAEKAEARLEAERTHRLKCLHPDGSVTCEHGKPVGQPCEVCDDLQPLRDRAAALEAERDAALRWKPAYVPLSVREGITTPEEWLAKGEEFIKHLQWRAIDAYRERDEAREELKFVRSVEQTHIDCENRAVADSAALRTALERLVAEGPVIVEVDRGDGLREKWPTLAAARDLLSAPSPGAELIDTLQLADVAIAGLIGRIEILSASPNRLQAIELGDKARAAIAKVLP